MEDHDLTAFELEDSGFKVRLEKGGNQEQIVAAPQPVATEEKGPEKIVAEDTEEISSPMVGTFYKSASPDADPYVKVGDSVDEGTVICIIEAMKVMNQIKADLNNVKVELQGAKETAKEAKLTAAAAISATAKLEQDLSRAISEVKEAAKSTNSP